MKKLIAITALILLSSCRGALISDDLIIVHEKHKIAKSYYYKYFYKCYQNGRKMRVYSNNDYVKGQRISIPLILK